MPRGKATSEQETQVVQKGPKISIPGVLPDEVIKNTEPFIPNIRRSLAVTAMLVAAVGQVRLAVKDMKPSEFSRLDSTNHYIRRGLAKSPEVIEVAVGVALTRTLIVYASNNVDEDVIHADTKDLLENLTGPSDLKVNLKAIMKDPERVRRHRRGLMLQVTGTLQATALHNPSRIHPNLQNLDGNNFMSLLPYSVGDLNLAIVADRAKELVGRETPFADGISVGTKDNITPLEGLLGVSRLVDDTTIADLELPPNLDELPAWKRTAVMQLKNLKKGGK